MSSVKAKPKPKPADDERLRDAWITLPLLLPVRDGRMSYELARDMNIRDRDYHEAMIRTHRGGDRIMYHTFDVRVRPEAVTGVSRQEGPDGAIVFINGVQHTCRMSPKAIWELLL